MKIKEIYKKDKDLEQYLFVAEEEEKKIYFGSQVKVYRYKNIVSLEWNDWVIDWIGSGSGTLEEQEPYFATIKAGMEKLRELQA